MFQGSSSVPGAGEGVFVTKDVPSRRVVAFFSSFIFETQEENDLYDLSCAHNTSLDDEVRRKCRRYSQKLSSFDAFIEIPPEFENLGGKIATLGPKVILGFRLLSGFVCMIHGTNTHNSKQNTWLLLFISLFKKVNHFSFSRHCLKDKYYLGVLYLVIVLLTLKIF